MKLKTMGLALAFMSLGLATHGFASALCNGSNNGAIVAVVTLSPPCGGFATTYAVVCTGAMTSLWVPVATRPVPECLGPA
ncbi:MAG: hypothetical protein JSS05_09800 [Proteobacteria bacterium]|nr:hypothetical protein [Pseudomonadota bacterium]